MRYVMQVVVSMLLAAVALAQRPALVAQNLSALDQTAWCFVGHPQGSMLPLSGSAVMPGGFAARFALRGSETKRYAFGERGSDVVETGEFSPWVLDELKRLVPHFLCWQGAAPQVSQEPTILGFQVIGAAIRVPWRTRIVPPIDLTLEGWWTLWPGQDVVDITLQAVWGTTATAGMSADLGQLQLVIGERPTVDHAKRKGLPEQPTWHPDLHGGMWAQTLATPRPWGRASRIQWSGALLCLPAGERWGSGTTPRHKNLEARLQGPLVAVSGAWTAAGSWGALGALPSTPPGAQPRPISNAAGDEYDQRPLGEFKWAGTTGEHPDYGCSRGEDAAALLSPAAVHDYRWQVQAWGLRPTSNREPDGRPIRAADHPHLATYNQRPHKDHGDDVLGWTWPIPFSLPGSGYASVDDQHRSDNLLVAAFQLTRDPCMGSWISDVLELEQRRIWRGEGGPIGAPRDWGRTQLAWAHYTACGFESARPLLRRSLDAVWAGASLRRIPQDATHTVRVLADDEWKYGYTTDAGQPIRTWNPWQEGIAVPGLVAVWKQTGDERAKELAIAVSETLVRHAFYQHGAGGDWWTAYSVRWRTDDPGAPLPAESYWPAEGANKDVFTYGAENNMLGAVLIAQAHSSDAAVRARATAILAAYPVNTWDRACWMAIGP